MFDPKAPGIPALQWLSEEYYDLNGTQYDILEEPPSAIEFSRLVHIARPVVIKGYDFPALHHWSDEYLVQKMGDQAISLAMTPNGRADAVTPGPGGMLYFVEPHTEHMTMELFLKKLADGKKDGSSSSSPDGFKETAYLQSQNGNIYSAPYFQNRNSLSETPDTCEFEQLRPDVPSEVSWCSDAFGKPPEAVNIWIGDKESVTSVHNDPYENIYTVIRGMKHFTLLPPTEGWCLKERMYPHARYARATPTSYLTIVPSEDLPPVRWSSIVNPHLPEMLPPEAHPIYITLHAGETLYLPAGWWHHVRQGGEGGDDSDADNQILDEDRTIAVNWWYDMEGILYTDLFSTARLNISTSSSAVMPKDKSEKKEKKEKKVKDVTEDADDVEMGDAAESQSPKKSKKDKEKEEVVIPVEDLSPLAHPLANKKLLKKLHKTIKKASKSRQVKRGVKEVVKGIRKGERGLLILAADINPIDIISHLPILSEEAQVPYVFVTSKEELGHASSTKRPTSCVMVCPNQKRKAVKKKDGEVVAEKDEDDWKELYEECYKEVEKLDHRTVF
ncbi:hypothetical protein HWV62_7156 [Athelia sp. TMB]|nr:hypothetical protein HWV62_7156 [Athelia sp. TMB]